MRFLLFFPYQQSRPRANKAHLRFRYDADTARLIEQGKQALATQKATLEAQLQATKDRANQLIAEERRASEAKIAEEKRVLLAQAEQFKATQMAGRMAAEQRIKEVRTLLNLPKPPRH